MKVGDRGWVMGYNSATPSTIIGYGGQYGSTVYRVTLDNGEVVTVHPDCFLREPREVEQVFQERIDYWQQKLNAFRESINAI